MDQSQQLAEMLADLAPTLRARIRARRGARPRSLSTSDIYATVVRRTLDLDAREGVRAVAGETPERARESPRMWALLHLLIDRAIGRADRSRRREQAALQRLAEERRESRASDAAETVASEDLRRRAAELVASLDPRDRELLTLRLRGEEWAAIANATGLNTATCRQRWHRLLERLATAIGESEPTDRSGAPRPSAPPAG